MTAAKVALEAQMAGFRIRFAERLAGEEVSLRAALDAFLNAPSDGSCRALRLVAHKLAGSGGLLGFAAIGMAAAQLDEKVSTALEGGPRVVEELSEATYALLDAMAARTQVVAASSSSLKKASFSA